MNTMAMVIAINCTDCHNRNTNLQSSNMKITLNTTKGTLQPYSQDELKEIAENVLEYQKKQYKDYAYLNEKGQLIMHEQVMWSTDKNRLYEIAKDLYRRGAHQPKEETQFISQVIGTTIC